MHPVLLLWDIDSTLIHSGGAGLEALRQALLNRYGVLDDLSDIEIAGRTDTAIARDVMRKYPGYQIETGEFLESYLENLERLLPLRKGQAYPGVKEILEWSHAHSEVHNALLTGNVKKGAFLKLKQYGLDGYFEFGAFGSDSSNRNELGPIAMERARQHLKKEFQMTHTWVIGDTPHDIACGRKLGCRVLAVATGQFKVDELEAHQPDLVYADLADYQRVIKDLTAA